MDYNERYHKSDQEVIAEQAIIEQSKENPRAFEKVYNAYYKQILQFVYQRLDSKETAIDITQNTFLKALQNLPKYQFKGLPFSSWLYRIALNELNDFFRKNATKRTVNLEDNVINLLTADSSSNEDAEEHQQKLGMLKNAIQQLQAEDFLYIEMRFFEGRPFAEIAEILEITENNAKVKTYRILEKLKKIMTPQLAQL
jgi:RNA polymerase sigma-70 factor (ECF subfamily)